MEGMSPCPHCGTLYKYMQGFDNPVTRPPSVCISSCGKPITARKATDETGGLHAEVKRLRKIEEAA